MSVFHENMLIGASGQGAAGPTAGRSVRFNSADSAFLSRTPASAGNRKTWTWSGWVKRSKLGAVQYGLLGANNASFFFTFHDGDGADGLRVYSLDNAGSTLICNLITTNKFRDPSAWYHILLAIDTTQATDTNRVKIYVNNSQITTFSTAIYPSQNDDLWVNSATAHRLGALTNVGGLRFDGYLADCYLIDGQQLTPSSFGETNATTGQWVPRQFSGTYGTNGFKLTFSDNSNTTAATLGADTSGNGNNWTPNNLSVTAGSGNDSLRDHPTSAGTSTGLGGEVSGNYCTLNPLDTNLVTIGNLQNGNLEIVPAANYTGVAQGAFATIGVTTGKWYFEGSPVSTSGSGNQSSFGWTQSTSSSGTIYANNKTKLLGLNCDNYGGQSYFLTNGVSASLASATNIFSATSNDVMQIAVDFDAGKVWFGRNGTWYNSGNPAAGTNATSTFTNSGATWRPWVETVAFGDNWNKAVVNFGARSFAYQAPSGFKALCDTNLTAPTIAKPNTVMDALLWTGNGSARSITGLGFNPDLVWIKGRSNATDHALYDAVRGTEKRLESNTADAEVTSDGGVTAFNSDGFSLGTLAQVNTNSATYVGWAWDAGSSNATNTSGSTQSTVRASISAGFSVVTYAPSSSAVGTVGHGLGVAPEFYIVKKRNVGTDWAVYHKSIGATKYLRLNGQLAATTDTMWNNTEPTSSVFSYGKSESGASSGDTYVAYCWTPVAGYSAFGSYTGTGSATDSPFIWTGFRPAVVIVKRSNGASDWVIQDNRRPGYNTNTLYLRPNSSSEETDSTGETNKNYIDFLSNGFKLRGSDLNTNAAQTYIYCAWAEAPFPYSRAR